MQFLQNKQVREIGKGVAQALLGRKRITELRETLLSRREYRQLLEHRREHLVEVGQPLVLISQIQRSGGTLLSQLFDAHPQCHAHPYELYLGYPNKATWPVLDLTESPDTWFRILFERRAIEAFQQGYRKYSKANEEQPKVFPFLFLRQLQKDIFHSCVSARAIKTERDIVDCYMTSYFNAWLDNQNLYGADKRYITAFVPRMNMAQDNYERFFNVYPDGVFVSIVRDPRSWYASARKHKPEVYENIEEGIGLWKLSTESTLKAKERYGDRVYIIRFEDLVGDIDTTMQNLCDFLGLDFTPIVTEPTFNGMPIKADSSYVVKSHGVIKDPLVRYRQVLSADELNYIEQQALDLYERVLVPDNDRSLCEI